MVSVITRFMKFNPVRKKLLLAFVLLSMLSGCGTPGLGELHRLCKEEGHERIDKVVYVDGYYDSTITNCQYCATKLVYSGFGYIEFNKIEEASYYPLKQKGYWKIYKTKKGDKNCNVKVSSKIYGKFGEPFESFSKELCIAFEKIEKPTSRYKFTFQTKSWYTDKSIGTNITSQSSKITDLTTGEVIASSKDFLLNPTPDAPLDYGRVIDCYDEGFLEADKTTGIDLRRQVIKPMENKI